ncbi:50S ribosomal protein L25/general stress protein Ctc [Corynebacterium mayonis]|uniref:50S ribosomal protein L25/general stress protein Ctc n=1 Tax=Corynebacterium mayonis TaxID=3062461 RepID=UPI00313FF752
MAIEPQSIPAKKREEFGKGASRRLRRAGRIPGVLYESGVENYHFSVDRIEFTALVRSEGTNAVLELDLEGEKLLCMVKHVDQNMLTLDIDHVDLLGIKRGEKVVVEVPVVTEGEAHPDAVVLQEADVIEIEVDALAIPDELTVSIEGKQIGDQILASDIVLPAGAELTADPESLIVNITYFEEDAELEAAAAENEEGGAEGGATPDSAESDQKDDSAE